MAQIVPFPWRPVQGWAEVGRWFREAAAGVGYSPEFAEEVLRRLHPLFDLLEVVVDPPTVSDFGDLAPHADVLAACWTAVEDRLGGHKWTIFKERIDAEILNCVALGWR